MALPYETPLQLRIITCLFVACSWNLGFWSCLELELDLNSSGTVPVLEFLVQVFVNFCTSLCARVPCGFLICSSCFFWTCCLVFSGWVWQFNLYRGCLFEKGSAQLSYQDWLITPRVQKTTPPRNFLSLKFRSQMFQVTGNQLQTFRNRFETLFQFVVGFCLDDPNLRGLGFPRSQARGADTWYPLGFYPNTQKVWTPRPCPEDKPLVPVPLT